MQSNKIIGGFITAVAIVVLAAGGYAWAQPAPASVSENYQMTEMQFGGGSTLESCSGEYCAQATIGDLSVGESSNENTAATFGSNAPEHPLLEVIVDPGVTDFGVLETTKTATKTMVVRIKSYMSDGYMLQIVGDPPKTAGHTMATPKSPTTSKPGTEQFAINVAANTTPAIGANPVQVPSGEMSFGYVEEEYATPNRFMYRSGDVVARSDTESGRTDYTVSMIVNISNKTPAGHFSGDYSAIVTPVY